ncbi:MAG: F0F1 ATP synthase subunit B [Vicinamibacteria bacterium]|nr:F0F1 ATP synthase subunit B [Vicinamibacteria bacterium]
MLPNLTAFPLLAGGLTDINLTLTAFTLILFTLFVIVLSKFAWGPLLAAIDEREKSIRDALEGSQKANAEAAALLAQHKDLVRQIGAEREEIIKKATKEAEEFRIDLMAKARTDGDDIVRRAKEQIARESAVALAKLREEVADLAVLGAAKIVASSMTPEAQKKLVSDFVSTLPQVKN